LYISADGSLLLEQLGLKNLALEVIKTGRRIWLTIRIEVREDTVEVEQMVRLKEYLSGLVKEVYPNTKTEVILDRI
jgi:hypothetical protein